MRYKEHYHYLGKCDYNRSGVKNCKAFITWELKDTPKGPEFSACADIWNPRETDIYMGGQCLEEVAAFFPGDKKARRIIAVWKLYHLNGMKAGCEHQEAAGLVHEPLLEDKPPHSDGNPQYIEHNGHSAWNTRGWWYKKDHPRGLLCEPCEVCGYKYGSAWCYSPIPADVLAEIRSWG